MFKPLSELANFKLFYKEQQKKKGVKWKKKDKKNQS